jgi:copper chaperone NosL
MTDFLRREHHFLRRPLNVRSRLLLVVAAAALMAAVFLPLWKIHLVAPQYREGLALHIYTHKLVGGNGGQDLNEINVLNHYIGMKPLMQADFVEMKWLPFAFGVFVLLALRAAAIGRMVTLVDLLMLFIYFGAFSLGSFYFRLYSYGHTLDPKAPMTIEPFTPIMLGSQKIANFVQTSLPQAGSWLLALFPLFVGVAMWCSRKEEP